MKIEQTILQDLFSNWISLSLEYARGAPGLQAIYIYGSAERGSVFIHAYFEQFGKIVFPEEIEGIDTEVSTVREFTHLLFDDHTEAKREFAEINTAPPTEYRVHYNTMTKTLDVQISHDLIYAHDPVKVPEQGIEDWLGDRAPKIFG